MGHAQVASKSLLVGGLNALMATVSTPLAAPVVAAARLRGGNAGSARGAAAFLAEALGTARETGATGLIMVRADSAYYAAAFVAACRRGGAPFSVTVRRDSKIRRTITTLGEGSWVAITYPNAIVDEQTGTWISDTETAEVPSTAFASPRDHRTNGRLIVRRVRRLNPKATAQGQHELFATYRSHAVFTDSPFPRTQAESDHRGPTIIEQVFADLIEGPLAHLPSACVSRQCRLAPAHRHHARAHPGAGHASLHPPRRGPGARPSAPSSSRLPPGRPQRTRPDPLAPARGMTLARRLAGRLPGHPPATHRPRPPELTTRLPGPGRRPPPWTS